MSRAVEQFIRPNSPEREEQIRSIIAKDRQAYTNWLEANPEQPRLDLTPEASRYLIPDRLYSLTDNPNDIQIRTSYSTPNSLGIFVVEKMPTPITDAASFKMYRQAIAQAINSSDALPRPDVPLDVDPKHDLYRDALHRAGVSFNDKIILGLWLNLIGNDEIFVRSYDDRPGYRKKGVANSFYNRLREVGRSMNTRYIVGNNFEGRNGEPGSIDYFVTQQGRVRFSELTGKYRDAFWKRHRSEDFTPSSADFWTIDFLDPNERVAAISVGAEM